MKLVKEHITFKRGEDPKSAMGTGIYSSRTFISVPEFVSYVLLVLPIIFNGKIPDDILSKKEQGMLPTSYYDKIKQFMYKCGHQVMGDQGPVDIFKNDYADDHAGIFSYWPTIIRKNLEEMGYKRPPDFDL